MAPNTEQSRLFGEKDGVRGLVNADITPELVLKIGQAAGIVCNRGDYRHRVVIGKDLRLSGYMIEPLLVAGFTSVGVDVIILGPIPTPAVALLTHSMRADLGVMITASHEPYDRNGLKLFGPEGEKLSAETEMEIKNLVDSGLSRKLAESPDLGRARRIDGIHDRYIEITKKTVQGLQLEGVRVVVDCANGAAYKVAPQVLSELGAEVVEINVEPDGFNINRNCGFTDSKVLQDEVGRVRADLGVALDGDGDRVKLVTEVLGVVESGILNRRLPRRKGDGLAIALQVLNRMRPRNKLARKASDVCKDFQVKVVRPRV